MDKLLTISIAAYNVEDYIERALDSLLDPRVNDKIEVLVCDDGGEDRTITIAKGYALRYPETVIPVHKENGGYGSVLNTNVALATGKYFKVLDGDDWFDKENFIRFVGLLAGLDVDYVVSGMSTFYESSKTYETKVNCGYMPEGEYIFDKVEFRKLIGMHSSTFRTSILKGLPVPFTEHCFYTDNELVQYSVPYLKTLYLWHHPVYIYYIGRKEASNSVSGIKKHYKEQYDVFWRILEVYNGLSDDQVSKRQFVKNRLTREAANHFKFLSYFLPNRMNYKEMCEFRDKLQEKCPDILESAVNENLLVRYFIVFGKAVYPFLHFILFGVMKFNDVKRKIRALFGNLIF